jgi:hypothetical protein
MLDMMQFRSNAVKRAIHILNNISVEGKRWITWMQNEKLIGGEGTQLASLVSRIYYYVIYLPFFLNFQIRVEDSGCFWMNSYKEVTDLNNPILTF